MKLPISGHIIIVVISVPYNKPKKIALKENEYLSMGMIRLLFSSCPKVDTLLLSLEESNSLCSFILILSKIKVTSKIFYIAPNII